MVAIRDVDTEALAWAAHVLGWSTHATSVELLSDKASPFRVVRRLDGEFYSALVDVSTPAAPSLLLAPSRADDTTDLAYRRAFFSGARTASDKLSAVRAVNKGMDRASDKIQLDPLG